MPAITAASVGAGLAKPEAIVTSAK